MTTVSPGLQRVGVVPLMIIGCWFSLVSAGGSSAETLPLEKVKQAMGDMAMRIEHKEKFSKSAESNQPPFKGEQWIFECGVAKRQINYSRYVNSSPQDRSPSLINSDMGIGLDLDAFRNWYRGNMIRVTIGGKDVMAQKTAAKIESKSDRQGYLRFTWDLEKGNRLTLSFVVSEDGHVVYALVDVSGPSAAGLATNSLAIHLTGYPGGYGTAYKSPSHRTVQTAKGQGEVPDDYMSKEYPVVPITPGEYWVFYADKLMRTGALGLVFVPSERLEGKVHMSNYGVGTTLQYPAGATSCALAFFAYDVETEAAFRDFSRAVDRELAALKTMRFWPEENP